MAVIFDGKKLALEIENGLKKQVFNLKKKGIKLGLAAILIGQDPASKIYLQKKKEVANRLGIDFYEYFFNEEENQELIKKVIQKLNKSKKIQGILIQLPLPKRFADKEMEILASIDSQKDIDCLTPFNFGLLAQGKPRFFPATVKGILRIIKEAKFKVKGKNVVILGKSKIVGMPLGLALLNLGGTVSFCSSSTKDLSFYTKEADLLISATGVANLVKKEMVKKGAVVIDVGAPKPEIDFEKVKEVASFITPVPGGVGPMTVISLMENLVEIYLGCQGKITPGVVKGKK